MITGVACAYTEVKGVFCVGGCGVKGARRDMTCHTHTYVVTEVGANDEGLSNVVKAEGVHAFPLGLFFQEDLGETLPRVDVVFSQDSVGRLCISCLRG